MKTLLGWLNNTGLFVGGLSVVFFGSLALLWGLSSASLIIEGKWLVAGLAIIAAITSAAITVRMAIRMAWEWSLVNQQPPDSSPKLISPEQAVRNLTALAPPDTQDNKPGFVYIVQSGQYYKIGITQGEVPRRVAQLQTGSPHKIHIVHVIETDCPLDLERDLHKMLAHKRGEGEWFRLSEEELRIIKRLK